jgi:TRAP-type C4-dicarboxylate transport system permease small subunit
MVLLLGLLKPLQLVNDFFGWLGRHLSILALGLMVIVILAQVFFRYALNSALPWPEEAARFLMLWLTGLMAPIAYRQGGFVAIDMLERALSRRVAATLMLALTVIGLCVLLYAVPLGSKHVASGCLFKSSTLWLPFTFNFSIPLPFVESAITLCTKADWALGLSFGWTKMPLAVMYASIYVGVQLLILVNIELLLRGLVTLLGEEDQLRPLGSPDMARAD